MRPKKWTLPENLEATAEKQKNSEFGLQASDMGSIDTSAFIIGAKFVK